MRNVRGKPTSPYWHMPCCMTGRSQPMIPRNARSLGLMLALAAAATAPFFACAAPEESDDEEASEDAVTGANNPLGLRLTYDRETNKVSATLKDSLKSGEQLRLRVRR